MVDERRILDEVDKTLRSFDDDEVLQENPYLFTRIQAKRGSRLRTRWSPFAPAVRLRYVAVLLLLLVNLITVIVYERRVDSELERKLVSHLKEDFQDDPSQYNF